jgi:hypothetical protein
VTRPGTGNGIPAEPSVPCRAFSRKLERGARPHLLNLARQPGVVHHLCLSAVVSRPLNARLEPFGLATICSTERLAMIAQMGAGAT